jgi:hypothetical protein
MSPSTRYPGAVSDDPTVWVRPWNVKREFTSQSEQENESIMRRADQSNYALRGLMREARMEEDALAEGRGSYRATKDKAIGTSGVEDDPLGIPR